MPAAAAGIGQGSGLFKSVLDNFREEIANFDSAPSMYAGLVDRRGNLQLYDGLLRFRDDEGEILQDGIASAEYADLHRRGDPAEFLPEGAILQADWLSRRGLYRVGPLARLNTADQLGTPKADVELVEFRHRFGRMPHSAFLYHYARLLEMTYALERMQQLLDSPAILDTHVRAEAGVNRARGNRHHRSSPRAC